MIYPKLSDGTIDWCAMCKHEGSDFNDLCCECEYSENSDDPPAKYEPKQITNADKLRAMSDEELADWFVKVQDDIADYYDKGHSIAPEMPTFKESWLYWLRQEAHDA